MGTKAFAMKPSPAFRRAPIWTKIYEVFKYHKMYEFRKKMAKSIRISEKTYMRLCELAGKLQADLKRPVSIDEAIGFLMETQKPPKITNLAGTLELSDEEVLRIKRDLRKLWQRWGPKSA